MQQPDGATRVANELPDVQQRQFPCLGARQCWLLASCDGRFFFLALSFRRGHHGNSSSTASTG
eukprot:COSAG01_NODE_60872_length_292_cov_0.989637_1_plen_63_part_01